MAVITAFNMANASVGDTCNGYEIVSVINAVGGRYKWKPVSSSASAAPANLSVALDATKISLGNTNGTGVTIPLSDNTNAGLIPPGLVAGSGASLPTTSVRLGQLFWLDGVGLYKSLDLVGNWGAV